MEPAGRRKPFFMLDEGIVPLKLTAGQRERFERLAMPHLAALSRAARYLARDDQQAEDLVQETMVKAMRAFDRFQEGGNIKAWLMTILRHAFVDLLRSNKHYAAAVPIDLVQDELAQTPPAEGGACDDQWSNPAALLERFEDREVIQAMKGLPESLCWTLLLVDVEQMDLADAAAVLAVPVGTVKSRAHRGRAMLRDRLYRWAKERGWVRSSESSHE
jgi:RNA polymerase sigma-70 factor, ECF subfamily